jgi:hypothetical protein
VVAGNPTLTLGAASSGAFIVPSIGGSLQLGVGGTAAWQIDFTTKSLLAVTDNTVDIGSAGALRPRNLYLSGTATIPTLVTALIQPPTNVIEQRNGISGQTFRLYATYTDASNYSRLAFSNNWGGNPTIFAEYSGTGSSNPDLSLGAAGSGSILFIGNGGQRWMMAAGVGYSLIANTDNALDIGQPGNYRPRTIYAATSVVAPLFTGGTINGVNLITSSGSNSGFVFYDRAVPANSWALYATGGVIALYGYGGGGDIFRLSTGGNPSFNGAAAVAKQAVAGSRGGNAALASLLTALSTIGLVTDSSTA